MPVLLHYTVAIIPSTDRLVGLMVRRPPREWKIPGSNPACVGIFSGSSHTSDFKIGIPVATLPGAWRYRVSAGTGRPGVSISVTGGDGKFGLQRLPQCGSTSTCLSRSGPEIHSHVAGTLSNQ